MPHRHDATPEIWQETALSAILRAILYADDANYRLMGYRKLDPITTPESELRFLQVAEALFEKGAPPPSFLPPFLPSFLPSFSFLVALLPLFFSFPFSL